TSIPLPTQLYHFLFVCTDLQISMVNEFWNLRQALFIKAQIKYHHTYELRMTPLSLCNH
ncbi:hypothetical protein STEG23_027847, partial [Scotinomys teguina]